MEYLDMVGLSDYAKSRIYEISGGQQQRVALARALIVEPKLCLLDEPFSNLDAALRVKMRGELKRLQKQLDMTMIFVTHDQEEPMLLGDQMAIMEQGRLIQCDTPENIYKNPSCSFVSDFLNLDQLVWTEDGTLMKILKNYLHNTMS
jgi:iron(III) transport system ATP-binding protein